MSDDKTSRLSDPRSGKEIHCFQESRGYANHLDFHPSGTCFAVATSDKKVKVYDLRMQRLQQLYSAHDGPVSQVSFHPNGSYLISASQDGSIKIFDLFEARPIYDVLGHKSGVNAVKFNTKGKRQLQLASIAFIFIINHLNFRAKNKYLYLHIGRENSIENLVVFRHCAKKYFCVSGNYFASGSDDKKVYIWKTNFDEVDEQLGITPKSTKESKVKYSIETPIEQEEENEKPRGILKEKSINVKESPNNFGGSSNQDSELSILSSKMDTIMKTLLLMDKRLSLVEDQLRANEKNE